MIETEEGALPSNLLPIRPDIGEFLAVLRREEVPKRLHHLELFLDRSW
jgi:hypothetical protein